MPSTRNERASAIHLSMPFRGMFPAPEGSRTAPDRVQAAFLYRGVWDSERWLPVVGDDENWTTEPKQSEAWTPKSKQSEVWAAQSKQSEIWTEKPKNTEEWTRNYDD